MKKFGILLLPVLLAGCSTWQLYYQNFINRMHTDNFTYQCDEQPLAVALNNQKQQMTFSWQGKPLMLQQGLSASGTRYSDGIYAFWLQGDKATLYRHDTIVLHNCKLPAASH